MGELLDLILDFEKKLLALIRDLVVRPQLIAQSIVEKDKSYLSSFKFYSIITTLWIIVIQFSRGWLDIFSIETDYLLPLRLQELFKSEVDFAFLIAPFVGLLEFFLPFGLINYALFYNRKLSILNHFTFNIYLGSIILLYGLIMILALGSLNQIANVNINEFVTILLILALPLCYYGYAHVKIFGSNKILTFIKPVLAATVIAYFSSTYLLQSPFHELLHKKILFGKYEQFDLKPDSPEKTCLYTNKSVSETPNSFMAFSLPGTVRFANAHIIQQYNRKDYLSNYFLICEQLNDTLKTIIATDTHFTLFSIRQIETPKRHLILSYNFGIEGDTTVLQIYSENTNELLTKRKFTNYISPITQAFSAFDMIWLTGRDKQTKLPVIGRLTSYSDSLSVITALNGMKNFTIDDTYHQVNPDSSISLTLLCSQNENKRLKEIRWVKGRIVNNTFVHELDVSIYKNEFNPPLENNWSSLHRGNLSVINDSTTVIGFQVMTDSSFALNIININTLEGTIRWSSIYTVPSDLSFNDNIVADEHSIYSLGRSLSIFRKGFSIPNYQLPYLLEIDLITGTRKSLRFLPLERDGNEEFEYFTDPQLIYSYTPSIMQDQNFIYWSIADFNGRVHVYTIFKNKLTK